jgi:nicotinamidase-related amidase
MPSALIVADMLSDYDFPDAEKVAENATDALGNIRKLIERARSEDVPVIYVNDNQGHWASSAEQIIERALKGRRPDLVEPILPPNDATVLLKVRHSVFYGTPLEYLLRRLEVDRVVIVGQVTEQCVLYSALDAYVRELEVAVPADAVAHIHADLAEAALKMMERNMHADVGPAADCEL